MLVIDPLTRQAVNPRLVYALEVLNRPLLTRLYPVTFTFQAAAAGNELPEVYLEERVPSDTIIDSVEFVIEQPGLFAGNIFKPQFDVYQMLAAPFRINVKTTGAPASECIEITADGSVPLAHFARAPTAADFVSPFGKDFVLGKDMNIQHTMSTVNALSGNSVPTTIRLTYKVRQIDDCCIRTISKEKLLDWLKSEERAKIYAAIRRD